MDAVEMQARWWRRQTSEYYCRLYITIRPPEPVARGKFGSQSQRTDSPSGSGCIIEGWQRILIQVHDITAGPQGFFSTATGLRVHTSTLRCEYPVSAGISPSVIQTSGSGQGFPSATMSATKGKANTSISNKCVSIWTSSIAQEPNRDGVKNREEQGIRAGRAVTKAVACGLFYAFILTNTSVQHIECA